MHEIETVQRRYIAEFNGIGDAFEQYAYLIELSALLPPLPPEKKTPERAVQGCQSHVWLDLHAEAGVFTFDADSDTYILKGVLYLLRQILGGAPLAEVAAAKITLFEETEIMATFEIDRQKGIGAILQAIRRFAVESREG